MSPPRLILGSILEFVQKYIFDSIQSPLRVNNMVQFSVCFVQKIVTVKQELLQEQNYMLNNKLY